MLKAASSSCLKKCVAIASLLRGATLGGLTNCQCRQSRSRDNWCECKDFNDQQMGYSNPKHVIRNDFNEQQMGFSNLTHSVFESGVFIINAHFNMVRLRLTPPPLLKCCLRHVMLRGVRRFTKNAHFCKFHVYVSPANIELGGSGANHHMPALCVRWAFIMKTPVHFFRWCIHHISDDQS